MHTSKDKHTLYMYILVVDDVMDDLMKPVPTK